MGLGEGTVTVTRLRARLLSLVASDEPPVEGEREELSLQDLALPLGRPARLAERRHHGAQWGRLHGNRAERSRLQRAANTARQVSLGPKPGASMT